MVVCISQPCGDLELESTIAGEFSNSQNSSNAQKIVRTMLRPHFHCSRRAANLRNVKEHIHPALAALWNEAEEWHLLASDHCDGKFAGFLIGMTQSSSKIISNF